MSVKISIVVPCYQVKDFIDKCINSILAQTFSDFEIVLVDDGSTDNTSEICDKYGEEYPNITVVHKANGGLSDARNEGMKYATGEYICFVDSDDYLHTEYLKILYGTIIEHGADVAVCGYKKVYNGNEKSEPVENQNVSVFSGEEAVTELFLSDKIMNYAWNKLYKKSLFDGVEYPKGKKWEDLGTTYKILDKSEKVVYTDAVLYFYLQRTDSISKSNVITNYFDIYELCEECYIYLKDKYPYLKEFMTTRLCVCAYGCWSLMQTEQITDDERAKAVELIEYLDKNGKKQIKNWCGHNDVKKKVQLYFLCKPLLKIILKIKRFLRK